MSSALFVNDVHGGVHHSGHPTSTPQGWDSNPQPFPTETQSGCSFPDFSADIPREDLHSEDENGGPTGYTFDNTFDFQTLVSFRMTWAYSLLTRTDVAAPDVRYSNGILGTSCFRRRSATIIAHPGHGPICCSGSRHTISGYPEVLSR